MTTAADRAGSFDHGDEAATRLRAAGQAQPGQYSSRPPPPASSQGVSGAHVRSTYIYRLEYMYLGMVLL